jgi:hypothetical protein
MSTAQEIVNDAFGLLTAIDINETGPSPTEMTKALRALDQMISDWGGKGLSVVNQTRTCVVDGTTGLLTGILDPLTGLPETMRLAPGMNVSGTGVTGRVRSIDDIKHQVQLDTLTTIQGSATAVTFAALPFESRFEQGVGALLALRLAPLIGDQNVSAYVQRLAMDGWHALQGNFMRAPPVTFDPMLLQTSTRRTSVIQPNG